MNIYVISSWWCWWYGGGLGQRSFIDQYGILAPGFAAFMKWTTERPVVLKASLFAMIVVLIAFNLFQTFQYHTGAIHYVSMTKNSYWETFLRRYPTNRFYDELVYPDYPSAKMGKYYTDNEITAKEMRLRKMKAPEFSIEYFEAEIRGSKGLIEMIREKAQKRNISVDSMIRIDANWLYNRQKEKLK
jgi:hypothetical protein